MSKVGWERIWICFVVVGIVLLAAVWLIVQEREVETHVPGSSATENASVSVTKEVAGFTDAELGVISDEASCTEPADVVDDWSARLDAEPGFAFQLGQDAAESHFVSAMQYLKSLDEGGARFVLSFEEENFLHGFLSRWVQDDPIAAYRWDGYDRFGGLEVFKKRALGCWAATDPAAAVAELDRKGRLHPGYKRDARIVLETWIKDDPDGAVQWAKSVGIRCREQTIHSAVWKLLEESSPQDALAFIRMHKLGEGYPDTLGMVAAQWFFLDPAATSNWIATLSKMEKRAAFRGVSDSYYAVNGIEGTIALVEEIWPEGNVHSDVAGTIVRELLKDNPKRALGWISSNVKGDDLSGVLKSAIDSGWLRRMGDSVAGEPIVAALLKRIEKEPRDVREEWVRAIVRGTGQTFILSSSVREQVSAKIWKDVEMQFAETATFDVNDLPEVLAKLRSIEARDMVSARSIDMIAPDRDLARQLYSTLRDDASRVVALMSSKKLLNAVDGARELIAAIGDASMRDAALMKHAQLVKKRADPEYILALIHSTDSLENAKIISDSVLRYAFKEDPNRRNEWVLQNYERASDMLLLGLGVGLTANDVREQYARLPSKASESVLSGWLRHQSMEELHLFIANSEDDSLAALAREKAAMLALSQGEVTEALKFLDGAANREAVGWEALDSANYEMTVEERLAFVAEMDFSTIPAKAIYHHGDWASVKTLELAEAALERRPDLATPAVLALLYGGRATLGFEQAEAWADARDMPASDIYRDVKLRMLSQDPDHHPEVVEAYAGLDSPSDDLLVAVATGFADSADAAHWVDSLPDQQQKDLGWKSIAHRFDGEEGIAAALNIEDPSLREAALEKMQYRVKRWGLAADEKLADFPLTRRERQILKRDWKPVAQTESNLLDEW